MNNNENKIKLNIRNNIYDIDINNLITLGNRVNNPKRNFLFISKVLGKHIEVAPDMCRAIGFLLASRVYGVNSNTKMILECLRNNEFYDDLKDCMSIPYKNQEDICVIGFAETATGLGMAVASAINNSYYITTTRENIKSIPSLLDFEEEHSHATTHKCFPTNNDKIVNADRIILVDDEITTGKSMLNIIESLCKVTNVKKYVVLSILDWRNEEHLGLYTSVSERLNIDIEVLSLIDGDIEIDDKNIFYDNDELILEEKVSPIELNYMDRVTTENYSGEESYLSYTGRFGIDFEEIIKLENQCKEVAKIIEKTIGDCKKVLVMGHGENIYIPCRIASYFTCETYFKSTTRSPIYAVDKNNYPINQKNVFYDNDVKYYMYNKKEIENEYDKVILVTENDLRTKLTSNMVIVRL